MDENEDQFQTQFPAGGTGKTERMYNVLMNNMGLLRTRMGQQVFDSTLQAIRTRQEYERRTVSGMAQALLDKEEAEHIAAGRLAPSQVRDPDALKQARMTAAQEEWATDLDAAGMEYDEELWGTPPVTASGMYHKVAAKNKIATARKALFMSMPTPEGFVKFMGPNGPEIRAKPTDSQSPVKVKQLERDEYYRQAEAQRVLAIQTTGEQNQFHVEERRKLLLKAEEMNRAIQGGGQSLEVQVNKDGRVEIRQGDNRLTASSQSQFQQREATAELAFNLLDQLEQGLDKKYVGAIGKVGEFRDRFWPQIAELTGVEANINQGRMEWRTLATQTREKLMELLSRDFRLNRQDVERLLPAADFLGWGENVNVAKAQINALKTGMANALQIWSSKMNEEPPLYIQSDEEMYAGMRRLKAKYQNDVAEGRMSSAEMNAALLRRKQEMEDVRTRQGRK